MTPGIEHFLTVGALLFCIGLIVALGKRNAIGVLMGVELMLNAVNINLVAFWHYGAFGPSTGLAFALIVIAIAAAEAAVGLAIILAIFRHVQSVDLKQFNLLKG